MRFSISVSKLSCLGDCCLTVGLFSSAELSLLLLLLSSKERTLRLSVDVRVPTDDTLSVSLNRTFLFFFGDCCEVFDGLTSMNN